MLVSTFYKKKSPQKYGAGSEENDQGPDHGEPVEQTSAEGTHRREDKIGGRRHRDSWSFFETLKTKSDCLNKRMGGLEDLFQLVANRLGDMKLEINNDIGELSRSVNQLKLTVEPKLMRGPELTTLKTSKFSIGVASDIQNMISQGTQYDERDFQRDS